MPGDTLTIIGIPQGNFTRTVRILCEEKDIPYVLDPAMPRTAPVDAIHPLGKIPVMRHGDVTLFESRAIAAYLELRFPKFPMMPLQRLEAIRAEQWVSMINTAIDRTMVRQYVLAYVLPSGPDGSVDRQVVDAALPEVRRQLGVLEGGVRDTRFLASARFAYPDAAVLPILDALVSLPEGEEAMRAHPALGDYLARCRERRSLIATKPSPLPTP